jgi:hypothetical protein
MTPGRMPDGSCNLLSALEAFDECDDSLSRLSGDQSSEGESAIVGQDCPRLRPFKVGCPNSYASKRALVSEYGSSACAPAVA